MTQAANAPGWPIVRGVQTLKEIAVLTMRQEAAAVALSKLWADTFLTNAGIDSVNSSGYTYRGSANYDVIRLTSVSTDRKLLLHFNGSDGSTTFTDSSSGGKTVTAVGNAQLDTAQQKFGTASLLLDGTGDCASLADSVDWEFGSGDFQLEAFVRLNATGIVQTIIGFRETGGQNDTKIYIDANNKLCAFAQRAGASVFTTMTGTTSLTTGVWYHVALYRINNDFYLTLNGVQEATANSSSQMGTGTFTLRIGAYSTDSTENFNGWIDEVRVIKAATTYTAPPFTPPTAELDNTVTASVRSVRALNLSSAVTSLMPFFTVTLNTGAATYYVSTDDGTTWTQITSGQVGTLVSGLPSGTQIRLRCDFTLDAELEDWGVAA